MDQAKLDVLRAKRKNLRLVQAFSPEAEANLMAGDMIAEIQQAIATCESFDRDQGDWLDDPVHAYSDGKGFGEETKSIGATKFQVTLALDVSGSMFMDRLNKPASYTMRLLCRCMQIVNTEIDERIFRWRPFLWAAGDSTGDSSVYDLKNDLVPKTWQAYHILGDIEKILTQCGEYKYAVIKGHWTRMGPLLRRIAKWETDEGDSDAKRLDLIITDGLWGESSEELSEYQIARNGIVQSVVLNFLPIAETLRTHMPERMWMYNVTPLSVRPILHNLVSEFIQREIA